MLKVNGELYIYIDVVTAVVDVVCCDVVVVGVKIMSESCCCGFWYLSHYYLSQFSGVLNFDSTSTEFP